MQRTYRKGPNFDHRTAMRKKPSRITRARQPKKKLESWGFLFTPARRKKRGIRIY